MDVGIIGGADGPTAIMVASATVPLWLYGVFAVVAIVAVALIVKLLFKNRK